MFVKSRALWKWRTFAWLAWIQRHAPALPLLRPPHQPAQCRAVTSRSPRARRHGPAADRRPPARASLDAWVNLDAIRLVIPGFKPNPNTARWVLDAVTFTLRVADRTSGNKMHGKKSFQKNPNETGFQSQSSIASSVRSTELFRRKNAVRGQGCGHSPRRRQDADRSRAAGLGHVLGHPAGFYLPVPASGGDSFVQRTLLPAGQLTHSNIHTQFLQFMYSDYQDKHLTLSTNSVTSVTKCFRGCSAHSMPAKSEGCCGKGSIPGL